MDLAGGTLFKLTWKERVTPLQRSIYALRASVRPISGNDYFGLAHWSTLTTQDSENNGGLAQFKRRTIPLNAQAKLAGWPTPRASENVQTNLDQIAETNSSWLGQNRGATVATMAQLASWPTPQTFDASNGNTVETWKARQERNPNMSRASTPTALSVAVGLAGWNTPAASDGNGGKRPHPDTTMTGQHPKGRKVNMGLASQVHIGFIKTEPARLTASGELLTGSGAGTTDGGQLNPAHSLWLMGLPPVWDACAAMVTLSSRRSPKPLSKPTKR